VVPVPIPIPSTVAAEVRRLIGESTDIWVALRPDRDIPDLDLTGPMGESVAWEA
jgi:hypothetical protein